LLDEPVAGVNPTIRVKVKELLKALKREGKTIVLIEHDMSFVMDLCDEIVVWTMV
jgi:branched-chain amino acid transport system ATP-binding protein